MSGVCDNVTEAVGNTPVVRLNRLRPAGGAELLAKLEYLNPGGSIKDRPLVGMLAEARESGALREGDTILDSSSGNFAVAMAMAGAALGHPVLCVVDPKLTDTLRTTLASLGAELVCATVADDRGSYLRDRLALRDRLLAERDDVWCPDQYRNPAAQQAHFEGTGAEILEAVDGRLDVLVAAVGTGATISGTARAIRQAIPDVRVVGTDATGSRIFDRQGGRWLTKGLGSGLSADELDNLDTDMIDEVRLVDDADCFRTSRALARHEGLLVGGSSGCAVFAALTVSAEMGPDARIVTLLPDRYERYLTEHVRDDWMASRQMTPSVDADDLLADARAWRGRAVESHDDGLTVLRVP